MEEQIHRLGQEAYWAVLRAFKAQGDSISWEKEKVMTLLRKELGVSDDEHGEIVKSIKDWREGGGVPTFSAARKKQKTSHSNPEALIGRRLRIRWPEDDCFYAAVITQYNAVEGRHAVVYDMINTKGETTWEWIDLKKIPQEDISWDVKEKSGETLNAGHGGGTSRGRALSNGGRGRGPRTQPRLATQNGGGRKFYHDEIELFNTASLVKKVERVFDSNLPDPLEVENAKRLLKEHEQALMAAIARLADASDFESGNGEERYSHENAATGLMSY